MPRFYKRNRLDKILDLNVADRLFLHSMDGKSSIVSDYLNKPSSSLDLLFIIKIANASKPFEETCKNTMYDILWDKAYANLAVMLSECFHRPIQFYQHNNVSKFDLFRGLFFYYHAVTERNISDEDFTSGEISLVREAIKYSSVHAIQRYNQYIYSFIESNQGCALDDKNVKDEEALLKEAVANCKKLQNRYGSYAYMMLAEAYIRIAIWHMSHGHSGMNIEKANAFIDAAKQSCIFAEEYLERSSKSIHNASLGMGLKSSNSIGLETPMLAKEFIDNWWVEQLSRACSSEGP